MLIIQWKLRIDIPAYVTEAKSYRPAHKKLWVQIDLVTRFPIQIQCKLHQDLLLHYINHGQNDHVIFPSIFIAWKYPKMCTISYRYDFKSICIANIFHEGLPQHYQIQLGAHLKGTITALWYPLYKGTNGGPSGMIFSLLRASLSILPLFLENPCTYLIVEVSLVGRTNSSKWTFFSSFELVRVSKRT